jgi:anti-anti-sigma factor
MVETTHLSLRETLVVRTWFTTSNLERSCMPPCAQPRVLSPRSTKQLSCQLVPDRDVITVEAVGEIDIASVDALHGTLRDLREAQCPRIRLDLRHTSFMDLRGLTLLLRWTDLALADGFELSIEPGGGAARHLIELVNVAGRLGCADAHV